MNIDQLISNVESLDIKGLIRESVDENRDELIRLQKDQMLHGYDSLGKRIGKYKNKKYAIKKHALNPLPGLGFKDEKLTGSFQNEIFIDARNEGVVFSSLDEKTPDIIDREGENIFGLNEAYQTLYSPLLAVTMNVKIINRIHG
jgi:hypothetical protein